MFECFGSLANAWRDPERIKQRQKEARERYRQERKAQKEQVLTPKQKEVQQAEHTKRLNQIKKRRAKQRTRKTHESSSTLKL
jgi:Spy/CpxP family protein refolding chaperone